VPHEASRELQIEIERVAEDIWDELSPEAKNALEAAVSRLMESE
jgi:thymidylate synthase ThyX